MEGNGGSESMISSPVVIKENWRCDRCNRSDLNCSYTGYSKYDDPDKNPAFEFCDSCYNKFIKNERRLL